MTVLAAISAGRAILYGVAAGLAVVLASGALLAGRRRPHRPPEIDIPPGMRPGPSDPDLEKPVLEKLMAWGLLLVVIMAIWLPTVFLRENDTNKADTVTFIQQSVERGRLTTMPGTEENQLGFNCERCHGPGLHGGQNVFNGTVVPVPNLQTVCGGAAFGHAQINSLQDVILARIGSTIGVQDPEGHGLLGAEAAADDVRSAPGLVIRLIRDDRGAGECFSRDGGNLLREQHAERGERAKQEQNDSERSFHR